MTSHEQGCAAGLLQMSLSSILLERRSRLPKAMAFVLLVLPALVSLANRLYTVLATPLVSRLPLRAHSIATGLIQLRSAAPSKEISKTCCDVRKSKRFVAVG